MASRRVIGHSVAFYSQGAQEMTCEEETTSHKGDGAQEIPLCELASKLDCSTTDGSTIL
jgi:hypothetical protein